MPPKRAGSRKRKEVLPDPQTLPSGTCNYYIGEWFVNKEIDSLSDISHSVVEAHTKSNGEVSMLPRTVVLIPPATLGDVNTHYAVEVADNLRVESIPRSAVEPKPKVIPVEGEESFDPMSTREKKEEEGDSVVPDDTLPSAAAVQKVGSSEAAAEVVIQGTVHIEGIVPRIVITPDLPEPPVVPKKKKSDARKNSKRKEEEQKRLAEEARIYEEKVNAAVAAAREEEEYRMQFPHPERWPNVQFANMTFNGQVIVAHAHVKFRNCCFTSRSKDTTQLLVAQYCKVECERCTFDQPQKGSVYGWPMSNIILTECYFKGASSSRDGCTLPVANACESRPTCVGLHTDACKITVKDCEFSALGTGVIMRGTFPGSCAGQPAMSIKNCKFYGIYAAGIILDSVNGVELAGNKVDECEYYALDCVKGEGIRVYQNTFLSKIRVQKGAHARFLNNETGTIPFTVEEVENPNWQPVY
ncbi:hypothetical protein, conserved [Trypanosoma brucei gambiense DAL972]|uniref:Right handed beta helix domain-containing protein n=1 Tax=Trypanosoma brucei gambiense (strain MHOM/CI/86/DAL972) TaxID=679716 RepID=C9ZM29_TRYB9|nr:hypothetical protein, conserved [Trypanosoma brucei gambiense DAL972]CBH10454.1 hypothetical protein, conserved [Trypanosoma brucei gambiense DAL972]|eukprot:XP_011772744.1 hypothetical protein, conserved [Trypanosoma brucei gambiense DAL972]